jgi:hypothetical protein
MQRMRQHVMNYPEYELVKLNWGSLHFPTNFFFKFDIFC